MALCTDLMGHHLVWEKDHVRLARLPDSAIPENPADFWTALVQKAGGGTQLHDAMYTADRHYKRLATLLQLAEGIGGTCLEGGCGAGFITEQLAYRFEQVDAVDICPDLIDAAPALPNVRYILADMDIWEPVGKYDLVFLSEIVEHLREPGQVIKRLGKHTRYILASAPVTESLNIEGAFDAERYKRETKVGDATGHIWAWDYEGFLSLFNAFDLVSAVRVERYGVVLAKT